MNPQQRSMPDDTITKNYFPSNSEINKIYSSKEFTEFLTTNAMTKDSLMAIATYFNLKETWNAVSSEQDFSIKQYYNLLLMAKTLKTKDNIWMSFYEGLHRHAALLMCLLCSKIDLMSNKVNYGSLTADYFKTKVSVKIFKEPDKSPLEQLHGIFIDNTIKAPMLTTLATIKAFVPKLEVSTTKQGDLDLLLKASRTYSENISITKRMSADKSMTVTLADILETIKKLSKAKSRNDEKHRPVLTETFKKQVDTTLSLYLKNMKMENDNNYQCYKFSDKLRGKNGGSTLWMH
jgi:hypothetical protein